MIRSICRPAHLPVVVLRPGRPGLRLSRLCGPLLLRRHRRRDPRVGRRQLRRVRRQRRRPPHGQGTQYNKINFSMRNFFRDSNLTLFAYFTILTPKEYRDTQEGPVGSLICRYYWLTSPSKNPSSFNIGEINLKSL